MTGRSPFVTMVQPVVGYHNLSSASASVGLFPRFALLVKEDEHENMSKCFNVSVISNEHVFFIFQAPKQLSFVP